MKIVNLILILIIPALGLSQNKKNMEGPICLKNKDLEVCIDRPLENYNFSRFDWTGKIVSVRYKGISVTGSEKMNPENTNKIGQGLYNEFGLDMPIGFNETTEGGWFHKIGIGALKKTDADYAFYKEYEIQPASFTVTVEEERLVIGCNHQNINGYAYALTKEIELKKDGFKIKYRLVNTGEKVIRTNEYNHNFLAINEELMGSEYVLKFHFNLNSEEFDATVNKEGKVEITQKEITFNNTPEEQFFFSNLTGSEYVDAYWELRNTKNKIGISETGSFQTNQINVWGWKHVISPELFYEINIKPGDSIEWSRTYHIYKIN